ncbi:hypothetical protein Tco_0078936 [Tanacetum coccineum]|uniref:Uncharacterized protein n=1 Tax=Tanacetum coccineum TaxID=301880 RepID=A0ABQ5FK61_9ASTR
MLGGDFVHPGGQPIRVLDQRVRSSYLSLANHESKLSPCSKYWLWVRRLFRTSYVSVLASTDTMLYLLHRHFSLPPEETNYSLPLKETCYSFTSCSLPPEETGCSLPPEETGLSLPPEETGCSLPPDETLLLSYFL